MSMIKKYLKKYINSEERLMIWDQCNSIIMKYQKIINFLDDHQISHLNLEQNWVEKNDDAREHI